MTVEIFHRPGQKTFGPWGNHTSSLDWCEDNYTHSTFIAEFWNTTSNIPFIALGILGVLSTIGLPNRSRYILAHAVIAVVGTGSFIFHGTLLWHAQVMLDELPMLWGASVFLYLQSVDEATGLKLLIASVPGVISWLYLKYPNPVLHQIAYAAIEICSTVQTVRLFKRLPSSTPEQIRNRAECKRHFVGGIFTFLLGFAIWNVDNIFCAQLTVFRSHHGELVGALTQGHAWWHLLTGAACSRLASAVTYLTISVDTPDEVEFAYVLGHPYVRRKGAGSGPLRSKSKAS